MPASAKLSSFWYFCPSDIFPSDSLLGECHLLLLPPWQMLAFKGTVCSTWQVYQLDHSLQWLNVQKAENLPSYTEDMPACSQSQEKERVCVTLTCDEKGFGELIMFEWLQCVEFFFMRNAMKWDTGFKKYAHVIPWKGRFSLQFRKDIGFSVKFYSWIQNSAYVGKLASVAQNP